MEIYSMVSEDNEEVAMQVTISTAAARGCVELWLAQVHNHDTYVHSCVCKYVRGFTGITRDLQVEEGMLKSIRHEVLMSYLDYEVNQRVVWVLIWPGMVVLCVTQVYWSMEVQNSLMTRIPSTMDTLYAKLRDQIIDMVELVRGSELALARDFAAGKSVTV